MADPPTKELTDIDWSKLVSSIAEGKCILLLGPDAVREKAGDTTIPVMDGFANHLRKQLPDERRRIAESHCYHVAEVFKNTQGMDLGYLRSQAHDYFRALQNDPARLHAAPLLDLARLPFHWILTTTPGLEVEYVLEQTKGKGKTTAFYNFKGDKKEVVPKGSIQRPLIFHLFGCIEDSASMVLSESDLLNFLVNVIGTAPDLPKNIRSLFATDTRCLFVGFGFHNWHMRILLHVLFGGSSGHERERSDSFAGERFAAFVDPRSLEPTCVFFKEGPHVQLFDLDLDNFARTLRERVEAKLPDGPPPAEDRPIAFISYAHEDRNAARLLEDDLLQEGIQPWIDEADLRGGEDWEHRLEDVIMNDVDYFIVLQSKHLEKPERYVNMEIKAALRRRKKIQHPYAFLFPVKIEDCRNQGDIEKARREESEGEETDEHRDTKRSLGGLHVIDLREDGMTKKLATDLLRDRRRQRDAERR